MLLVEASVLLVRGLLLPTGTTTVPVATVLLLGSVSSTPILAKVGSVALLLGAVEVINGVIMSAVLLVVAIEVLGAVTVVVVVEATGGVVEVVGVLEVLVGIRAMFVS